MGKHLEPENSLVHKDKNGQPATTTYIVAEGTNSQHRAVLQLVKQNLQDFEEFGGVAFEMQPFETAGGTQKRTVAVLNREHAMLLMTYMRNTETIRDFKKRLIRAFTELERRVQQPQFELPQDYVSALRELASTVEERDLAEKRARELEAPAKSWATMAAAGGDYSVSAAAKTLSRDPNISIGRDQLFTFMSEKKWIFRAKGRRKHWEAYQDKGMNAGRLTHKLSRPFLNEKTGEWEQPDPTVRVTPKGLHELHKLLGGSKQIELVS